MLTAGTRLGPYEVVASVGAGGMGEVYKGLDTRVDRAVAIKVLPTDAVIDPGAGERFEREARALASLSHPRVCGLFEYTRFDGRAVLILEYIEGHSLASAPKALFKTGLVADQFDQLFSVTGDGSRFLVNLLREGDKAATTTTLQVMLNWREGLAR